MGRLILYLAPVVIVLYALIAAIMTRPENLRWGRKSLWLLAIILIPVAGALTWILTQGTLGKILWDASETEHEIPPDDNEEFLKNWDNPKQ